MINYAWLIPLLPAVAAVLILFFGRSIGMKGAWLGLLATGAACLMSADLFLQFLDGSLKVPLEKSLTWFEVGVYRFEWGLLLDGVSLVTMLMVTSVSFLIQLYSVGYMHGALREERFFAYVSFFTASMLALVLSNNYLQFFIGWELMGACSYLLISFDFERDAAGAAGQKAFLTTRIGDLGFYAGLLLIFYVLGTFNFAQIQSHVQDGHVGLRVGSIIALLLFCGTVAKSAQVPLHVWLPDAMEGPTPVSALIHAATMVAAGIYLVVRAYPFFLLAPDVLQVVAWVGAITLVFAATIAITANDIKKVLAYSTISQLGYMVLGLGVMGYSAAMFHLTTHAAFKALLFLGAGSVIHAVHTNDLWKMGSLSKQLPTTMVTFAAGTLALVGFVGTSGFFSKEGILAAAFAREQYALFALGCSGAFLTSFYMMRAFCLTFLGEPRERDRFAHAQESPWSMTIPLILLALPALFLGFLMKNNLEKFFPYPGLEVPHASMVAEALAIGAGLLGLLLGFGLYGKGFTAVTGLAHALAPLHKLLVNKYFVDEAYELLLVKPTLVLAKVLDWVDLQIVDRALYQGSFTWMKRVYDVSARGLQDAQIQRLLLLIAAAFVVLALVSGR